MAAHARGAAAYATLAARRAAPGDPEAASGETQWQLTQASPAVRDALLKLPPPISAGGELGALIRDLHAAVAASRSPRR